MSKKKIVEVYDSQARTATPTAETVQTFNADHAYIIIDVTAATATPSVTPSIGMYDPSSGQTIELLAGLAITGTGTTRLQIGPGVSEAANLGADDPVPPILSITMTHADTDSITYTVSVHLC